jgi:hypothetical protein
MRTKRYLLIAMGMVGTSALTTAQAADWIMMQGTEPAHITSRFFGLASASYRDYLGCDRLSGLAAPNGTPDGNPNAGPGLNNGSYVNNCRIGPELRDKKTGFAMEALVLGARGNIVPGKINYLLAANFGQNIANYQPNNTDRKYMGSLTDASVTFNYVPGARAKVGLMHKPGPEELMQSFAARNYIDPTDFIRRNQIERYIEGNAKGTRPIPGQSYGTNEADSNITTYGYDADVGRDWGIQVFDAFTFGSWTHTYAVMAGNGNGIHSTDNNSKMDTNLYLSTHYDLPGGKGPAKHGIKVYGYHQKGVRNFVIDPDGTQSEDFDRIRYGIGVHALGYLFGETGYKHRIGVDLMFAEGMILQSTTNSITDADWGNYYQIAAERDNKAKGITLDYGFYLNRQWDFGIRYARNNLLYETVDNGIWAPSDERIITQLTLGVNYYFNPKTRLTVNYEFRESEAPTAVTPANDTEAAVNNAAVSTRNADINTSTIGDMAGIRLTYFF